MATISSRASRTNRNREVLRGDGAPWAPMFPSGDAAPASSELSRRRPSLRTRVAYSGVVFALALSLAAVVTLSGSDDRTPGGSISGPSGANVWTVLQERATTRASAVDSLRLQEREFRILAGQQETPPSRLQAHLEATLGAPRRGLHIVNSHHIATNHGNVWAVTGSDLTCLLEATSHGALACNATIHAARRGLALGLVRMSGRGRHKKRVYVLIGIAPDWVDSVQVRVGPRRQTSLPVQGNSYAMRAAVPILVQRLCRSQSKCIYLSTVDQAAANRSE